MSKPLEESDEALLDPEDGLERTEQQGAPQEGGVLATTLLLASSGMGSGMLALPYAVKTAGSPITALVILLVGFGLSSVSTMLILLGSARLNCGTYGKLITTALKQEVAVFGLPLIDGLFFVYLLACNISFLVFLGDFIPSLARTMGLHYDIRTIAIFFCGVVVIGPLTTANQMNFVSYVAGGGVLAVRLPVERLSRPQVFFTTVVVVYKSIDLMEAHSAAVADSWTSAPEITWSSLGSIGIFVFAFCIGSNVPPIAVEMKNPSVTNTAVAAVLSNGIMGLVYGAIGVCGYLSFLTSDHFQSDFIKNYPDHDTLMIISRTLLSLTILSVSVLNFLPAMKSLYAVLAPTPYADLHTKLLPRTLLTMSLAAACSGVAVVVTDIGPFIGWMGAILGAPELILAPAVLVATGYVGSAYETDTKPGPCTTNWTIAATVILLVFLWITAVASNF